MHKPKTNQPTISEALEELLEKLSVNKRFDKANEDSLDSQISDKPEN